MILVSIVLHMVFIILSYSADLLSKMSIIGDPVIFHRVFMLLQFLPLIVVLSKQTLLRSKGLLFLTFGVCVSTLFIVNDFASGFYGSISDYKSGLMPRMRASAHLMAYQDTGRIVILDFHAEYFLEYIIVHFLSEITGVNYILVYAFPVRLLHIVLWALVFTVACSRILSKNPMRLWFLLIASSFLVANQGYNYEISLAPLALLMFFLLANRERRWHNSVDMILMMLTVLLASFRETLTLAIISIIALAANLIYIASYLLPQNIPYRTRLQPFILIMAVMSFARTFIFSTMYYFESYANMFFSLIRSIQQALIKGLTVEKGVLSTILTIKNPVDRAIDMMSAISMLLLLTALALASLIYIIYRRPANFLLTATLMAYILVYTIPLAQYGVNLMLGYGVDFASSTTLARSLAPLVALAFAYYAYYPLNSHSKAERMNSRQLMYAALLILLSVTIMFAPLVFMARGEIKSGYDELRIKGPAELIINGNGLYKFVVAHRELNSIVMLDPSSRFLELYYLLPLNYETGRLARLGALPMMNIIYSNGVFLAATHNDAILLSQV
ncbi:MAG: hypothetical protein QW096_13080 [Thermofilaceae archaeon]